MVYTTHKNGDNGLYNLHNDVEWFHSLIQQMVKPYLKISTILFVMVYTAHENGDLLNGLVLF